MILRQVFPITSGWVVTKLADGFVGSGLPYAASVTVAGVRPDTFPARLVTVRDDSGPVTENVSARRYGVNVWHEDPVSCELLAHLGMAVLSAAPDGAPVVAVRSFAGPFRIDDDPVIVAGGFNLTHFYFTCQVFVRSTNY